MFNVGIVGLGTIGKVVAKALDDGMNGLQLNSVASGRREKAEAFLATLNTLRLCRLMMSLKPVRSLSIAHLKRCSPKSRMQPFRGKILVTVSGAGILANPDIEKQAAENGWVIDAAVALLSCVRAAAKAPSIRLKW